MHLSCALARTCGDTCMGACSDTCSATCSQTCAQTCSDTCGAKCKLPEEASLADTSFDILPVSEQDTVVSYDAEANPPLYVYYDGAKVPWATYKMRSKKDPLSWVALDDGGWGVAARAPQGSWILQPIYVPVSGKMVLYTMTADGVISRDLGRSEPGYRYLWFYADDPGRYTRVFFIEGIKSILTIFFS